MVIYKDTQIMFKCSPKEKEMFKQRAENLNLDLSKYIRNALHNERQNEIMETQKY